MNVFKRLGMALVWLCWGIILVACNQATPTPTPSPTPSATPIPPATPTPLPTRTPTPFPLASEENPIVLGIVSETRDPKAAAAADEIARQIAGITGFQVQARSYATAQALLGDLQTGKVHIVFLQPFTYLWAQQKGWVTPVLLSNHFGVYQYGAQFFANVSSKFTIFFDPAKSRNTVDPATALKQFDGKRPCWVEPTSASGYVIPLGMLVDKGFKVKEGVITQNHTAVIRALYITGICDFGVAFATTGDPRTASAVTQDLTDVMNRVVVIYQIDPIIPNLNVSIHSSLPRDLRDDLTFVLQSIVRGEKGRALLSTANNYEMLDLKPVDDYAYEAFRTYWKQSGVDLETLIGK